MHFDDHVTTGSTMPADGGYQNGTTAQLSTDDIPVTFDDTPLTFDDDLVALDDTPLSLDTDPTARDLADYDTDRDGTLDTAVLPGPAGGVVLLSDIDGDGSADVVTEITGAGQVSVSEQAGDGQWTVVERSRLGADRPTDSIVSIDPTTGEWATS